RAGARPDSARARVRAAPDPLRAAAAESGHAVGRRAADARDRSGAHDGAPPHPPRRALARALAEVRRADLRQARGDAAGRVHADAGRAERGAGAGPRRPRLRARARAKPLRGAGDRAAGGSGDQAPVPRRLDDRRGRARLAGVAAVAGHPDHADGPEEMGFVIVAPLDAALFQGVHPRRPALVLSAIEDHLGGVAVTEALLEELVELGPLARHHIEVTGGPGPGDKGRPFAASLPESLPRSGGGVSF